LFGKPDNKNGISYTINLIIIIILVKFQVNIYWPGEDIALQLALPRFPISGG